MDHAALDMLLAVRRRLDFLDMMDRSFCCQDRYSLGHQQDYNQDFFTFNVLQKGLGILSIENDKDNDNNIISQIRQGYRRIKMLYLIRAAWQRMTASISHVEVGFRHVFLLKKEGHTHVKRWLRKHTTLSLLSVYLAWIFNERARSAVSGTLLDHFCFSLWSSRSPYIQSVLLVCLDNTVRIIDINYVQTVDVYVRTLKALASPVRSGYIPYTILAPTNLRTSRTVYFNFQHIPIKYEDMKM